MPHDNMILGAGVYSQKDAARLIGGESRKIGRWVRGSKAAAPLWSPYFGFVEDSNEISFAELMELRVVMLLREKGLSIQSIRYAIELAKNRFGLNFPLSTQHFKRDGKEILLEVDERASGLISLSRRSPGQQVFREVVKQSLEDLEFDNDRPTKWWPAKGKEIVVDPMRSFGHPILDESGISTGVLNTEFSEFCDIEYLSHIYELPSQLIRNAIIFERGLDGQSPV
jgi:hypothetical protein